MNDGAYEDMPSSAGYTLALTIGYDHQNMALLQR